MEFDYKNAGIYAGATRAYFSNLTTVLFFSLMLLALETVEAFLAMDLVRTLIGVSIGILLGILLRSSFAYFIHRTVLGGGLDNFRKRKTTGPEFEKFLWRSTFFSLGVVIMLIPLSNYLLTVDVLPRDSVEFTVFIYCITIVIPVSSIFLALFGTILPAAVAGDDISFRAAYQRSRGQVLRSIFQLLIGPALTSMSIFAVSTSIKPVDIYGYNGQFSPLGAFISLLHIMVGFYPVILTVVILCKAYLHATPQTDIT